MQKRRKRSAKVVALILASLIGSVSAGAAEIELPPGYEIVPITEGDALFDLTYNSGIDLNDCGEVVWYSQAGADTTTADIFRYDNGLLTAITDDGIKDTQPTLNDVGTIAWQRQVLGEWASVMVYSEATGAFPLVTVDYPEHVGGATINNAGHIVWTHSLGLFCPDNRRALFIFDGKSIEMITDPPPPFEDQSSDLNEQGELTWTRYDDSTCGIDWHGHIMYRSPDGAVTNVTDLFLADPHQSQGAYINDHGVIAFGFSSFFPYVKKVILFDTRSGVATDLTDGSEGEDSAVGINNDGHVLIRRWLDVPRTYQALIYMDGTSFPITDPSFYGGTSAAMNNYGEAAFTIGGYPVTHVRLVQRLRTGDADFDGDVDADDFDALAACFTGPGRERLCECRFLDIDHDGDVDCDDWTLFADNWSGPGTPPPFPPCASADIDGDGDVDFADLLLLLAAWGPCPGCPEDLDGDGQVGLVDLLTLLSNWGSAG